MIGTHPGGNSPQSIGMTFDTCWHLEEKPIALIKEVQRPHLLGNVHVD
jgi:hypothetical protein